MSNMDITKKYRICRKCDIHHYENCQSCFGFGVYLSKNGNGIIPVSAGQAIWRDDGRGIIGKVRACPECGSTIEGMPPSNKDKRPRRKFIQELNNIIQDNNWKFCMMENDCALWPVVDVLTLGVDCGNGGTSFWLIRDLYSDWHWTRFASVEVRRVVKKVGKLLEKYRVNVVFKDKVEHVGIGLIEPIFYSSAFSVSSFGLLKCQEQRFHKELLTQIAAPKGAVLCPFCNGVGKSRNGVIGDDCNDCGYMGWLLLDWKPPKMRIGYNNAR
jgi:hypothetical protein